MFIVSCGATHMMEIWNIWHADYWLAGGIKAVTALASVPTAIRLFQFFPKALALSSSKSLEQINLAYTTRPTNWPAMLGSRRPTKRFANPRTAIVCCSTAIPIPFGFMTRQRSASLNS